MVNRNDLPVAATMVGGQAVYESGTFADGFGTKMHAGTFLAAWTVEGYGISYTTILSAMPRSAASF
jgi:hypothetical protein